MWWWERCLEATFLYIFFIFILHNCIPYIKYFILWRRICRFRHLLLIWQNQRHMWFKSCQICQQSTRSSWPWPIWSTRLQVWNTIMWNPLQVEPAFCFIVDLKQSNPTYKPNEARALNWKLFKRTEKIVYFGTLGPKSQIQLVITNG